MPAGSAQGRRGAATATPVRAAGERSGSLRTGGGAWGWKPIARTYCGALAAMAEEGVPATQVQLARRLGVSRGAVSDMVQRLGQDGLLQAGPPVRLTPRGRAVGAKVLRRHRLVECFLHEVLGSSWAQCHGQATRWAPLLDPADEAGLDAALGHPPRCPHGNPIPGAHTPASSTVRLSQLAPGSAFELVAVPEGLDATAGMLAYLQAHGATPGAVGAVVAICPLGARTLEVRGVQFGVAPATAARLRVRAR